MRAGAIAAHRLRKAATAALYLVAAGAGGSGIASAQQSPSQPARKPSAPVPHEPSAPAPDAAVSKAATVYALNCMGCHPAPRTRRLDAGPLRGEFFHTELGRQFFIRMPAEGQRLSTADEARLLEEVLTWRRACAAIRLDAPMVHYYGDPHAR